MEKVLIGLADAAQIAAWKMSHKQGIYFVEAGGHISYFRNPTRHDVGAAYGANDPEKPLAMLEKFAELTWIGGSDEMLKDDALFLGTLNVIKNKMNGVAAVLGEL